MGAERDLEGFGQGGHVLGGHAGEGGMVEDVPGDAAGPFRLGLRFGGGPGPGEEGVVPLAVELAAFDDAVLEVLHAGVADLDLAGVPGIVADGVAFQALGGDGGGDPGDGVVDGHQGPRGPGSRDVAEQAVLDLVPLAGAGREVADLDDQAGLLCQDGELVFPQPVPPVVGAAGVAGDQQPRGVRVAELPFFLPPQADRVHRERGGVAAGADRHESPVRGDVVDPVGDDRDRVLLREVMVADLHGLALPLPGLPVAVIGAELLLFLPVGADHGLPGRQVPPDPRADVPELAVPVLVLLSLQHLRHALQAPVVLVHQPRDRVPRAREPQQGHLPRDVPQRQDRPGDRRHGVAALAVLQQPVQRAL